MTVSHIWIDGKLQDAENLEDVLEKSALSYNPDSATFRML
jgi:hypothetical protein